MKNRLLQLVQANLDKPRRAEIKAEDDEATIYIYDVIGGFFGGVDAEQVSRDLARLDVSKINVRINSPGGDVWDARAIMTALRQHPATITAHIDGVAASAATDIAMAADHVRISKGAEFMIHNAWTIAIGNRHEFLSLAERLENVDGAITDDYARRTGQSREQVTSWMDAESWFTAEQAIEHGFADELVEVVPANLTRWDLSAYDNAPEPEGTDDTEQALAQARAQHAAMERRLSLAETTAA